MKRQSVLVLAATVLLAIVPCAFGDLIPGYIVAWGDNTYGQTNVPAGNDFVDIAGGYYHSLALKSDGSITAWAYNSFGQANSPAGNDYIAIAAGGEHSLAIKSDGSLYAWGSNNWGQTNVPAGNDFVDIAGGLATISDVFFFVLLVFILDTFLQLRYEICLPLACRTFSPSVIGQPHMTI